MKTIVATLIAIFLAVGVYAADHTVQACTSDHKKIELITKFDDKETDTAVKAVADAFIKVSKDSTYEFITSVEGYYTFLAAIPDDAKDSLVGFGGVPQVVGECK